MLCSVSSMWDMGRVSRVQLVSMARRRAATSACSLVRSRRHSFASRSSCSTSPARLASSWSARSKRSRSSSRSRRSASLPRINSLLASRRRSLASWSARRSVSALFKLSVSVSMRLSYLASVSAALAASGSAVSETRRDDESDEHMVISPGEWSREPLLLLLAL